MKRLWYRLMHSYVTLALHFYFRKIVVHGKENIPASGPVMFLANHQNALIDALLVATTNKRHTHFLARADLFKNILLRWLLSTINMKPIYRIRDGWSALSMNTMTFDYCERVLNAGEGLLLFPEGNHDLRRRVRPLSKGFTRIIDHARLSKPTLDLKIIPVGINYTDHQQVWSSVSVYYGEPISLIDYLVGNDIKSLREEVSDRMKKLVVHIKDIDRYEDWIAFLQKQSADFLDPLRTNKLIHNAREVEVAISHLSKKGRTTSVFGKILLLPFHFIPSVVWQLMKRKIKDPVFVSTVRFGLAISLFPINFLLQGFVLWVVSPNYSIAFCGTAILSLPVYGYLQGKP